MAKADFSTLDPCVHCGFCLPACPTYLATSDEADSPRGRIVLMRALERGEVSADDDALLQHLDACLGCRGCEPVCPSGVGYGRGLESARALLMQRRGLRPLARLILRVFRHNWLWRPTTALARLLRGTGIAQAMAGPGPVGFSMAMVAATGPLATGAGPLARRSKGSLIAMGAPVDGGTRPDVKASPVGKRTSRPVKAPPIVALFRGCVMDGLFSHVHAATRRVLAINGYTVLEVSGQVCCGALHEHAGDQTGARRLAESNLAAFAARADFIVVNSAGCGALLKDYGHLLEGTVGTVGTAQAAEAVKTVAQEARLFGKRVRDVTELLVDHGGPVPGGPLALDVAYDAPCHLQHAQRVIDPPLKVMRAIPELRLQQLPGSDQCCGSAGIYSMLESGMSRAVLDRKIASIAEASPRPNLIATGNPGCLMQIGAGLKAARLPIGVVHPVELLDWSYRVAGRVAGNGG